MSDWLARFGRRQMVRPWALSAPVAVLLIALPLLRPLRSPGEVSENELSRLATVQALVEHKTLAIDGTEFLSDLRVMSLGEGGAAGAAPRGTFRVRDNYYSDRPPAMAFLLSWAYEGMYRLGYTFEAYPIVVAYVLTVLGVTLPVAGAAGLIYRMSRLFELRRHWRAMMALAVVLGSGLISYSVVLNPHAPAAALVLSACACLLHVHNSKAPTRTGAWLMLGGLCAAAAAVIDPSAAVFLGLLGFVVLAFRWNWGMRVGGVLLYVVGATPPLVLHACLTVPVTGDIRPGFLHPELTGRPMVARSGAVFDDPEVSEPSPWITAAVRATSRALGALVGHKGLLTHYPVVVVGLVGLGLVLRRHWPASTKVMAGATLLGAGVIVVVYVVARADWTQAMFGPRWFVVFLPLVLFWAGAWLRRPHHGVTWAAAGVLLLFSAGVGLIGAAGAPLASGPKGQYSVLAAVKRIANGGQGVGVGAHRSIGPEVAGS